MTASEGRLLGLVISFVIAAPAFAQDPCAPAGSSAGFHSGVGTVGLVGFGDGRAPDVGALGGAAEMWNTCAGIPRFSTAGSADETLSVVFHNGLNDGRVPQCGNACGCFTTSVLTIHVFERDSSGLRDCTATWSSLIAHEVGHYLGLGNAQQGCTGCHIMGNTACGPEVGPSDCTAVDPYWLTPAEAPSPEPDPCNDGGMQNETQEGGCCQGTCTPILIDLGGGSFHLSDASPPVAFDIDGDGDLDQISWTRDGADEGFLALDRNGNGAIDDGSELFGAATEQPHSAEPNGFAALAVFDHPANGGNGDGVLSAEDAIFPALLVWTDTNRDGRSQGWELGSLDESGVAELRLDYVRSQRQDQFGNLFRWTSSARSSQGRRISTSDVIFVRLPESVRP